MTKPRPIATAGLSPALFMLWEVKPGEFEIYDQRCARAHAHTVWAGTAEDAGLRALDALATNPPAYLPCH